MGIEFEHHIEQYRYPGTKFFEPHQRSIFFGREQETHDLIYSLKTYDVFVIFADSGIGKTSMLNAGLIPELKKENIEPVKFRFQDTAISPFQTISDVLFEYKRGDKLAASTQESNLWRLYKDCDFNNKLPLFIFDQFEEFFNHPKLRREECINELADLVNPYLPDSVREEMRVKFRETDPTPAEMKYYAPARIKLLFLIRADKLKLLDDFSKKIPLILRNRFHLKPLSVKQAEQAILLPALLPKNEFASPSFNFEEEAVTEICNYLKNEEGEVESFQLQILCQELEKRIIDRYQKKEKSLWINREELGGETGMDNITKNYYTNQLQSIRDQQMRQKAIELIEDKLIVENRRISLPEILLVKEGFSKELLDYLLNTTRLIRVYNDRNARYFEISHDRLLPSILKLKQQRTEEENRLNELRERQLLMEEQEKKDRQLQQEQKINRRFRMFSFILGIMLIGLLFAFRHIMRLDAQTKIATAKNFMFTQEFDKADSVLKEQNIFSVFNFSFQVTLKKLADSSEAENKKKVEYTANINIADNLISTAPSLFIADSLIAIADSLASQQTGLAAFTDLDGKSLLEALESQKLLKAREFYKKAQQAGFTSKDVNNRVEPRLVEIDKKIPLYFGQCINGVLVFLNADMQQRAQRAYIKAHFVDSSAKRNSIELNPYAIFVLDSLQKVLKQ
ncbi:MAG: hypothetical protein ABIN89_12645 [Chitinophagaceae bacterium]